MSESYEGRPRVLAYNRDNTPKGVRPPQKNAPKKARLPLAWVFVIDVFVAALLLLIFSLYYFILPTDYTQNAVVLPVRSAAVSKAPAASSPAQTAVAAAASTDPAASGSPVASASPAAPETPADTSMFGAKFPGRFTDGPVENTDNTYKSANVDVSVEKVKKDGATYFVADIYVKDIKFFKTALAHEKYGRAIREETADIAKRHKAVLAVNGDFCSLNAGPVVRNGVMYSREKANDVLAMMDDGTMQTYTKKEFDIDKMANEGLYQVWTFGPMLLKDGQPMKDFNVSSILTGGISDREPRTAIGYYEPGHYCMVVVDGRQGDYSHGHSLEELSQLFYDLGCKVAFNLDGGKSSEMIFRGKLTNHPFEGGRDTSDIILIADE
jgi:exopolysaccharide biosynthesis protein